MVLLLHQAQGLCWLLRLPSFPLWPLYHSWKHCCYSHSPFPSACSVDPWPSVSVSSQVTSHTLPLICSEFSYPTQEDLLLCHGVNIILFLSSILQFCLFIASFLWFILQYIRMKWSSIFSVNRQLSRSIDWSAYYISTKYFLSYMWI